MMIYNNINIIFLLFHFTFIITCIIDETIKVNDCKHVCQFLFHYVRIFANLCLPLVQPVVHLNSGTGSDFCRHQLVLLPVVALALYKCVCCCLRRISTANIPVF